MTERKQHAQQGRNKQRREQALHSSLHRADHLRYGADTGLDQHELPGESASSRQGRRTAGRNEG